MMEAADAKRLRTLGKEKSEQVVVHCVLHPRSLNGFLFRLKLAVEKDEALAYSKHFRKFINVDCNARRS